VALSVIGGLATLFTVRDIIFSVPRQLVLALQAAGITFGIGGFIALYMSREWDPCHRREASAEQAGVIKGGDELGGGDGRV